MKFTELKQFKAVVIGASAGGIDALEEILPRLPRNYPVPIIIVLHIPPDQPSLLSELFASRTRLRVKDAVEKETLEAGTIYFAPPGYHLLIEQDMTFALTQEEPVQFSRPSIDILFESASDVFGKNLVGILLTGANRDGAAGLKRIQDTGGLTLIQDPATAQVQVMPEAASNLLSGSPGFNKKKQIISLDGITHFLLQLNDDQKSPMLAKTDRVKILLVDDLRDNLLALEGVLRRDDLDIFKVKSGTEALELMIAHEFALALIDVKMPVMSGFELAELMRGTKKTKNVPIIFVTATAKERSFAFKGYESGAVDFLLKPLDIQAVKSKVNIFIELYRQKKALNTQLEIITRNQKEQEELLLKLKKAQEVADQANNFKSAFLANMSHEIRTPLGAMLGFADLLRDPGLSTKDQTAYLDILSRNGQNLAVIINDILDLSKVESGHLQLEFVDVDPDQIANEVVSLLAEKAKEKGLALKFLTDETTPKSIVSDPTRVRQVLLNLVGNAIKFTSSGSVQIQSSGRKSNSGSTALCFEVTDTGIGIPESQKASVFEMFVQADETITRRFGGTGLGLALSKKLANSLGGDISIARTTLGKGSTFLFQVGDQPERRDLKKSTTPEEMVKLTEPGARALEGMKILIADDSPDNRFLISHYLTKYGATVDSVNDGDSAYQKALAGNYHVVLMDIQMPGTDGYTATSNLREAGYLKPIFALTAHAMSEVKQKCLDAGCTGYLTKPINANQLVATVANTMRM